MGSNNLILILLIANGLFHCCSMLECGETHLSAEMLPTLDIPTGQSLIILLYKTNSRPMGHRGGRKIVTSFQFNRFGQDFQFKQGY